MGVLNSHIFCYFFRLCYIEFGVVLRRDKVMGMVARTTSSTKLLTLYLILSRGVEWSCAMGGNFLYSSRRHKERTVGGGWGGLCLK